ncbi:MAG: hypothetical protein FK733_18385 [Asgard group archaeon]|nr:hypothetical protein [Asgard group archaeon]
MGKKVKPGMTAKEIATLHYELIMANDYDEWLKTFRVFHQERAKSYGSSPDLYWRTGRRYIDELGYTYKFKNFVENQSSDKRKKFFFFRYNKDGDEQGQVPIHIVIDEDDKDEWRVDVASW